MIHVHVVGSMEPLSHFLRSLTDIDFDPLMEQWEKILVEDNRKGVLEGTDGWGHAMPPLVYRHGSGSATAARGGAAFGSVAKRFKGFSSYTGGRKFRLLPFPGAISTRPLHPNRRGGRTLPLDNEPAILPNNNLSTAAYQRLTGPRLAPRREASRAIANYGTRSGRDQVGWYAEGAWHHVVDPQGREFLEDHFEGWGVPRYDLRRVRPWGVDRAVRATRAFLRGRIGKVGTAGDIAFPWRQLRRRG